MKVQLEFAKATIADIPKIAAIYDAIHSLEEAGRSNIGWDRHIYPTEKSAREAVEAGDMFVAICSNCRQNSEEGKCIGNNITAAARINKEQVHPSYDQVNWKYKAQPEDVMVLHTLVVDPRFARKGIGRQFVSFYEDYARKCGCKVLRMDTNRINRRARAMYGHMGYREAAIVTCDFNGIPGVELVCLEKKL